MVQTQQNFPGLRISGGCLIKYFLQIIAVLFYIPVSTIEGLPLLMTLGKESAYNVIDVGSILRLERSPGEGNDDPLQYSCLTEEPDRLQSMGSQRVRHGWVSANTCLPLNLRDYPSQVLQCDGFTPLDWSRMSQRDKHDLATEQQPTWHHLRAPHCTSIRFICSKPPVNPMEYSNVDDRLYHIGGS